MNNKKEKRQQLWSDPKVQRYFSTKKREFFIIDLTLICQRL